VVRKGKWDIPGYFGDGSMLGMSLGYLIMGPPFGPAYTLEQAYPFVQNALVAFGFPDILFESDDGFVRALNRLRTHHADVVLGLVPARQTRDVDRVAVRQNGRVRSLVIKPLRTRLRFTWIFAVWSPVFTSFLHEYVTRRQPPPLKVNAIDNSLPLPELSVGEVIQAAIENELMVDSVMFPGETYVDIGTPDNLLKAVLMHEPKLNKSGVLNGRRTGRHI
jgi:glucose-1-phosphate thymidylyltransferase